jgi:MAP/microtubule affinity-regulating kinase
VALKLIPLRSKNGKGNAHFMQKEVQALSKLQHKGIVQLYEYFPHPTKEVLCVVMEYLAGGELYEYWCRFPDRKLPEAELKHIFRQILLSLEYCHGKKVIHRDIKLQNILLSRQVDEVPKDGMNSGVKVKLVDFGIFGSNGGRVGEKQTAGSLKFMSPEVLLGKTESTPKIDIWALGCILHALVLGCFPFADKNPEVLKEKILKRDI